MDLHKTLVATVLREGKSALGKLQDRGITAGDLEGSASQALAFIEQYTKEHGNLPALPVVEMKCDVADLAFHDTNTPIDFLIDELTDQRLVLSLRSGLTPAIKLLDTAPRKALESMEDLVAGVRKQSGVAKDVKVRPLFSLGKEVLEYYQRIKKGERGVPTPWITITDSTLGWWPEDLILFVARSGVGKTWASLLATRAAWKGAKKTLYVTTEMAQVRIALRFFAIDQKIPYDDLRKGKLSTFQEAAFTKYLTDMVAEQGIQIMGGAFDFRPEALMDAIEESKPDFVVFDGIYLMKVPGTSRTEQGANAFNEVKRICKAKQLPMLITSQFNREVKQNQEGTVKAESIALTDVAVWNSDLIFGMVQTEDYKKDRRMVIKNLKSREGSGEDIECNWDFQTMNFEELPKGSTGSGSSEADEFGLGDPTTGVAGGSGEPLPF